MAGMAVSTTSAAPASTTLVIIASPPGAASSTSRAHGEGVMFKQLLINYVERNAIKAFVSLVAHCYSILDYN